MAPHLKKCRFAEGIEGQPDNKVHVANMVSPMLAQCILPSVAPFTNMD